MLVLWMLASSLLYTVCPQPRPPIPVTFEIREEMEEGSRIGNVADAAHLSDVYSPAILQQLRFSYLTFPSLSYGFDMVRGTLVTDERIDREAICPMMDHCEDKFDVAIQPLNYFQIIKVTIVITDINDNWPTFSLPNLSYQLIESAALGTSIPVPSAVDADSTIYGIQNYTWDDPSGKFYLDRIDKMDGSTDLKLILTKELDREWEDEYKIVVTAFDGSGLSGSTNIFVTVLDANDNNPLFLNNSYDVEIVENLPLQHSILRVHAMDLDSGVNGEILYSFSQRTQNKYGHLFEMDTYSGDIRVIGEIDYEEHHVFHLGVIAEDQGPGSLPADATVVVRVKDTNDNAPEIVINTLTEPLGSDGDPSITTSEVMENSDVGTFVAHVTVNDKDQGVNGRFDCFLSDDHFRLDNIGFGTEYAVVTTVSLDRETRGRYELQIECADSGEPMQTSVRKLRVDVGDENDHAPAFKKHRYTTSIDENNYGGVYLLQVNATDEDIGPNANITYVIAPQVKHLFALDETRGILSAKVRLNREDYLQTQGQIRFDIMAFDQGNPQKYGTAKVVINIRDTNDETPTFTQETYSFGIFENEPLDSFVGKVTAVDNDSARFNKFKIRFSQALSDSNILQLFKLNNDTGEIRSLVSFDTEQKAVYQMVVIATDTHTPSMSSSARVAVYIGDRNDNHPIFTFPTKYNRSVQVSGMLGKGHFVTRVQATDKDQGDNARLTYQITGGNSEHLFSIHSITGVIVAAKALRGASREEYRLDVTASDNDEPQQSTTDTLHILVNQSLIVVYHGGTSSPNGQSGTGGDFLSGNNLFIVIALAAVSAFIAVILIIAIIVIHRRSRDPKDEGRYNCRQEEAKKILQNPAVATPNTYTPAPGSTVIASSPKVNGGLVHGATLPRNTPTLTRNQPPSLTPDGTTHSIETHHLLTSVKKDGDQESCGGSCQDSGRGTSEDEHATPIHKQNGMRKASTDHLLSNRTSGASAASYNKRKPNFRTFSPVNTLPYDKDGGGSSHSIDVITAEGITGKHSQGVTQGQLIAHASPKPMKNQIPQTVLHINGRKTLSPRSREDHTVNSYTPGYSVDPDDINEFMLSNAREDAV